MSPSTQILTAAAAFGGVLAGLAGCRTHDKPPPPPPAPLTDAGARTPPADAAEPGLGPYSAVRARFERACPPDAPSLHVNSTGRWCEEKVAGPNPRKVRRWLAIGHEKDDSQPRASTDTPLSSVDVVYRWPDKGAFHPVAECALVIDETVAYLRDLTGLSAQRAQQVASAMRAHPDDLIRFVVMDREVCATAFEVPPPPPAWADNNEESRCGALISVCYLFQRTGTPLVDVDLGAISADPVAPGSQQPADDGGSNGRQ